MAKPIGNAPAFCLLTNGTNNRYSAQDVSKGWIYITQELKKIGIGVLSISSDSDPKFNAAMRINSGLGNDSSYIDETFKCGSNLQPPFYIQDYPHIATKLRNLLLKTIANAEKLPFGDYFIQHAHLQQLIEKEDRDKHLLTATVLNPADRQNFSSAIKICDDRVIDLLIRKVDQSEGTAIFLRIMSNLIHAFDDRQLSPTQRLEKMWYSVFMVRIWRKSIMDNPKLILKNNFMSLLSYYCIEQNAHGLILILSFLKRNNLTHLFFPYMFCSQPCESFYRQIRSLSNVNSTVVNFSTKEILNRISRIQLMSDISNDKSTGLIYPTTLNSCNFSETNYSEIDFPNEHQMLNTIKECKTRAIEDAKKVGLISKTSKTMKTICNCYVTPYSENCARKMNSSNDTDFLNTTEKIEQLETQLFHASLKNYANKFNENCVPETSSYVEMDIYNRRFVFKKTSLCWLLAKENYKSSSDRMYRVRHPLKSKLKSAPKIKSVKIHNSYKKFIPSKRLDKRK